VKRYPQDREATGVIVRMAALVEEAEHPPKEKGIWD
jgi:hypothetical protein